MGCLVSGPDVSLLCLAFGHMHLNSLLVCCWMGMDHCPLHALDLKSVSVILLHTETFKSLEMSVIKEKFLT